LAFVPLDRMTFDPTTAAWAGSCPGCGLEFQLGRAGRIPEHHVPADPGVPAGHGHPGPQQANA